jgi:cytochrome c
MPVNSPVASRVVLAIGKRGSSMYRRRLPGLTRAAGVHFVAADSHAGGDAAKGETAFIRQCALCHTANAGEPNRFGPNLFGILDRKAGSVPGFRYSAAFRAMASWNWSADVLAAWITSSLSMVPGTTMGVFQGVADRDRGDIVAYLATRE